MFGANGSGVPVPAWLFEWWFGDAGVRKCSIREAVEADAVSLAPASKLNQIALAAYAVTIAWHRAPAEAPRHLQPCSL